VLAVVDAGVDPAVLTPPPAAPAPAPADENVVDASPKTDPGAAADADVDVDVVAAVRDDGTRDGDPNEKPTLPALGGVEPSLLTGATPNPNGAGVADGGAPPKANGDDFAGEPNCPPNMLLGGGSDSSACCCCCWPFSLSSADFAVPNMLLAPPAEPAVSANNLVPGARLNAKGACADGAGLSFSLSFSSAAALSEPEPNSAEAFGGLLKSKVLAPPLPPPPKGKVLDEAEPVGADVLKEKADFCEGVDSGSFGAKSMIGLSWEEDAVPVRPEKGEDDDADAGLWSEDAAVADEKPKGDGSVVGGAGLGVNAVAGAVELIGAAKPAKPDGGAGIVADTDTAGLRENGFAVMEGLLG
jgi:hypothetical protein